MDVIIDIQFLKGTRNQYIPKEVDVVAVNGDFSGHWMVKSPIPLHYLSENIQKQNSWLKQHRHRLDYFDGEVTLKSVKYILRELSKSVRKIYVRGNDKWLALYKFIPRQIINLEYDQNCPSFNKLSSDTYCIHHAVKPSYKNYSCALNNAYKLKAYLAPSVVLQENHFL